MRSHGKRKPLGLATVTVALLAILATAGAVWLRHQNHRALRNLLGDRYESFLAYTETPIPLPADWQVVESYHPEVILNCSLLENEIGNWRGKEKDLKETARLGMEMLKTPKQDPALAARLRAGLVQAQPFIAAVTALIEATGYEVQAWPQDRLNFTATNSRQARDALNNTSMLQIAGGLFLARAAEARSREDFPEAFEEALRNFQLEKHHPAIRAIRSLILQSIRDQTTTTLVLLARECDSPDLLRKVLQDLPMDSQDSEPNPLEDSLVRELVAEFRAESRGCGADLDLSGSPTPSQLVGARVKKLAPPPGPDPPTVLSALAGWILRPHGILGRFMGYDKMMIAVVYLNFQEAEQRRVVIDSKYRLMRLFLSQRVLELEGGEASNSRSISELCEFCMKDPATSEDFLWDNARACHYGVGPDLRDDHNSLPYSPTNGTISAGDLSVHWE
jgi:hypothetical protein